MMFTAIVVAMILIFWAAALGLLDFDQVWVRWTYLWPGVVGGLVMGIGFIVGGYCPGTSLVSMATLKLDGTFFLLGILFGVFLFGETVGYFTTFWNSTYYARLTLPDLLGVDPGLVVFVIVCLALVMFWGAEKIRLMVHGKGVEDR